MSVLVFSCTLRKTAPHFLPGGPFSAAPRRTSAHQAPRSRPGAGLFHHQERAGTAPGRPLPPVPAPQAPGGREAARLPRQMVPSCPSSGPLARPNAPMRRGGGPGSLKPRDRGIFRPLPPGNPPAPGPGGGRLGASYTAQRKSSSAGRAQPDRCLHDGFRPRHRQPLGTQRPPPGPQW